MITVTVNTELSGLRAAANAVSRVRPLLAAAAQAVAVNLKKHFLRRDAQGNAFGWPRSHFWKREGTDKTAVTSLTDSSAVVSVSSPPIAHKLTGDTIRPGPGRKCLSIPLTPEAKKAGSPSLGVIPGLFLMVRKGGTGRAFLATADALGARKAKGAKGMAARDSGIRPQYLLVRSVTQAADPDTLPPAAAISAAAQTAANAALARQLRQPSQNQGQSI